MKISPQFILGIFYCLLIGLISLGLSQFFPLLGKTLIALLLGLICNRWLYHPKSQTGIHFCEKNLLKWAVMLMGIRLSPTKLQTLGWEMVPIILISVLSIFLMGFLLARIKHQYSGMILLVSIGTAICGSAAIAASSPFVSHKKQELGASIAIVNLIGLLGIFLLPPISSLLNLDPTQTGLWIGATLQAVGHVAAAGDIIGGQAADIAICTKMGRVFLLLPLVIILGLKDRSTEKSLWEKIRSLWYLWGFIGFIFLNPIQQFAWIKDVGSFILIIAMAGIGLSIHITNALKEAKQGLFYGSLFWVIQVLFCGMLLFF